MKAGRRTDLTSLLWELPLACLSFLFFKATRFFMRRVLVRLFLWSRSRRKIPPAWSVSSAGPLATSIGLPWVMVTGPRWNPHAITAICGPFRVERSLAVEVRTAFASVSAWTVVLNTFPSHRTLRSTGTTDAPGDGDWESWKLEPGRYVLALRYYNWQDDVVLPAVHVDGNPAAAALRVPGDNNAFYSDLGKRRNLFYRALHFYVFTMLELRGLLPASFVRREFLPIGNPDSQFRFGTVHPRDRLGIRIDERGLEACDLYLCVYDRASFPVHFQQLTELRTDLAAVREKGFFLVRIRPKSYDAGPFLEEWLSVENR